MLMTILNWLAQDTLSIVMLGIILIIAPGLLCLIAYATKKLGPDNSIDRELERAMLADKKRNKLYYFF